MRLAFSLSLTHSSGRLAEEDYSPSFLFQKMSNQWNVLRTLLPCQSDRANYSGRAMRAREHHFECEKERMNSNEEEALAHMQQQHHHRVSNRTFYCWPYYASNEYYLAAARLLLRSQCNIYTFFLLGYTYLSILHEWMDASPTFFHFSFSDS